MEPRLRLAAGDLHPIDHVEHPREGGERRVEGPLDLGRIGQEPERGADQAVRRAQGKRRRPDPLVEPDLARPRDEQPERDRLRISIGELFVVGLREEQPASFLGEVRQGREAPVELLEHFVAQEPAEPRRHMRELEGRARRDRLPLQEVRDEREKARRRREARPGRLDVACKLEDLALQNPIAPQPEALPVGLEEVGQRLQLGPFPTVVRI
jgi:hypothetical protein